MAGKRLFALLFCTVVFVHVLLWLNTTYSLHYSAEFPDDTVVSGLSREQYKQYIMSLDGLRADAISGTQVEYFGVLPSWTMNIVYCLYFAMVVFAVVRYVPHPVRAQE